MSTFKKRFILCLVLCMGAFSLLHAATPNQIDPTHGLQSLTLKSNTATVNVEETVQLSVMGTYSDRSSKTVDENITYTVTPTENAEVNGSVLTAKKDGNVIVQATVGGVNSNNLNLTITWVVNGHRLPPEPDPTVNNATLLGIDVNGNGVRDDVERWIIVHYAKYPKYPKTKTAIALQYAWALQKILENPTMKSKKYLDDAIDCQYYWLDKKTENLSGFEFGKFSKKNKVINNPNIKDKIYSTKERIKQYFKFNAALSGNIFDGRDENITNCHTNIDALGE